MGRLADFLRRLGRSARRSRSSGTWDDTDRGQGTWLSVGGVTIGLGGSAPDRDHDGIPDSRDSDDDRDGADDGDSGGSDDGDSGGDD